MLYFVFHSNGLPYRFDMQVTCAGKVLDKKDIDAVLYSPSTSRPQPGSVFLLWGSHTASHRSQRDWFFLSPLSLLPPSNHSPSTPFLIVGNPHDKTAVYRTCIHRAYVCLSTRLAAYPSTCLPAYLPSQLQADLEPTWGFRIYFTTRTVRMHPAPPLHFRTLLRRLVLATLAHHLRQPAVHGLEAVFLYS